MPVCLPRPTQSKRFRVLGFFRRRRFVSPPFFLYVHRSFTFGRHPSSVSVALHCHFIFSRRSFLDHAQVESLSGWVTTYCGCARLLYFGRAYFGRMERDSGFTCLSFVSVFSHAVPRLRKNIHTVTEALVSAGIGKSTKRLNLVNLLKTY